MAIFLNLALMVGMFTLFYGAPACMSVGLCKVSNDDYKATKKDYIMSWIPVYNNFYGWHKYSGSWVSLSGIGNVILILSFIMRYIVMIFFFYNDQVQTITVYIFFFSFVAFWILCAVNIWSILSDTGVYTFGGKVFNALCVPIGQLVIGNYMPNKMRFYMSKNKKGNLYGRS